MAPKYTKVSLISDFLLLKTSNIKLSCVYNINFYQKLLLIIVRFFYVKAL